MIWVIGYVIGYLVSLPIIGRTFPPEEVRKNPDSSDWGLLLALTLIWPLTLIASFILLIGEGYKIIEDSKWIRAVGTVGKRAVFGAKD